MAEKFPPDRFDRLPDGIERVGAHRAPVKRGRGWVGFAWAAAATIVLVGAGIAVITIYNDDLLDILPGGSASSPPGQPASAAPATLDPAVPVTILNGTSVQGLAATAGGSLGEAGITVGATTNASDDSIETTIAYYSRPELEGAARGVIEAIGMSEVIFSEDFVGTGSEIVLILGSDYAATVGE